MDPLSDVLSLLKPRSYMIRCFDAAGDWSVRFERHEGIKCYAVVSGACWLAVEGVAEPVRLTAGDCLLLPRGWPFRIASDLSMAPTSSEALISTERGGGVTTVGGGGDCMAVGGYFAFHGDRAGILLSVLPPVVHIRRDSDRAALRWAMDRMMQELREPQPGGHLMAEHLAHLILVQALRAHVADGAKGGVGWLFALADRQMSAAIGAMHGDPAFRWTLQALAEQAGMSRSSFALKFKATVGASPMDYLTRWRMLLAADRLESSGEPVSTIALALGYEFESAFSTAFKRVMGLSPRQYGRRQAKGPSPAAYAEAA